MNRLFHKYLWMLTGVAFLFITGIVFTPEQASTDNKPLSAVHGNKGTTGNAKAALVLSDKEKEWLSLHKTVRIAFDGYFPPYSFLNERGEIEGLAVDVMKLLADRTGIKLEISPKMIWKDLYEAAQKREVDVVATMGHRPEREEWFLFTQPYIFKSLVIMTREEEKSINAPADLANRTVAVVKSYQYVKTLLETYPSIKPYYVDTMLDGLNAVAVGKADAAVTFIGAGHYLKKKHQIANLKFAAVYDKRRFTDSIAVRKDWPELASILDKGLASIEAIELKDISQRWAGPSDIGIPTAQVLKIVAGCIGIIVLIALVFTVWNRTMRSQVKARTKLLQKELSARIEAEEKLMNSEKLYHDLVETAQDLIWQCDNEGRYVYLNNAWEEVFGYRVEEMLGRKVTDFQSPEIAERDMREFSRFMQGGTVKGYETVFLTREGKEINLVFNAKLVQDSHGAITGTRGTAYDITQRKLVEDELRITNEELQAINRIITTTTTTTTSSTGVKEILEKVLDEALNISGLEGGTICMVTPDERLHLAVHRETSEETIKDLTENIIKVGDCLCGECARDHKPLILRNREEVLEYSTREATRGEDIRFHAALPLIIGARCLGVLCVFTRTDFKPAERRLKLLETVTAQIAIAVDNAQMFEEISRHAAMLEDKVKERTEALLKSRQALTNIVEDLDEKSKALQEANIKLKEVDKLKSMFIASMSHELRTPLNSIIGFTGIILQGMTGDINEEQRDQLQRVSKAGKHLLSLITDVIDVSKIEAGKIEAYPEEFELEEVLNDAVANLKLQIKEKGLELEVNMVPEKIILNTDRKRLFQCILNYLSNAVKFTEKGKITVIAEEKGGIMQLEVTDTGIGIKEKDIPMLFQSFVRLDSPLKMTVAGTGLGLYLTRKLVTEMLNGEVSAESTYGKGSTFMMRIPVKI